MLAAGNRFAWVMIASLALGACSRVTIETPRADDRSPILAGPMIGHVTDSSAQIWARVVEGGRISARLTSDEGSARPSRIEDLGDGFCIMHFENLSASTDYEGEVVARTGFPLFMNRRAMRTSVSLKTAPLPSATGKVRIAFGSCSKDSLYPFAPVFEAMAAEQPDLAIFVGDNSYFVTDEETWKTSGPSGDWDSAEQMQARHLRTRTNPSLQNLLRTTPCYAVWDDHDYGPNNADETFPNREIALNVFEQVWANPSYGTETAPGIFGSFRHGPVEIFLMDDRYYKNVEQGRIWGDAQLEWLLRGLAASTAPVKVIANGTQVISQSAGGEGHWREARGELERLLAFLKERRIGGIVFLSGDRHFSEAMRWEQEDGPLLVEFTSSPIQQNAQFKPKSNPHPNHLWATEGNSYGLVTIEIGGEGPDRIQLDVRDANNFTPVVEGRMMSESFLLSQLQYAD